MYLHEVYAAIEYDQLENAAVQEVNLNDPSNTLFLFWKNYTPQPAIAFLVYNDYGNLTIIFNDRTKEVHALIIDSEVTHDRYIWFKEEYQDSYREVYLKHDDWPCTTDCSVDILQKSYAILRNRIYDKNVVMTIEGLDNETIERIKNQAVRAGITFDEHLSNILMASIELMREADSSYTNQG